ncbi:2-dehydro-3-deoxygalactonokinase [Ulvibacterium sp.]|uniref:2-dehydro-3-deoxygalactonokinase n=1 Tax=Ulvibacterium sp. TaxID=2665914 RepID=UPI003BAADF1E
MNITSHFISCDWGTSNFRLRLIETETLQVIWENRTDQGVKRRYAAFKAQTALDQKDFYLDYLMGEVQKLPDGHRSHPIIASGMSSSNIGLCELPYADLPFDEGGNTFISKSIPIATNQDLLLISGVKSETGMMRGEEVQAIGLGEYLHSYSEGILLLPGTHSKHISYRQGSFHKLKNFMTGELFEVLGKNSILSNSIEIAEWDAQGKKAFLEGFHLGLVEGSTPNLLGIRARHVVEDMDKKDNYFRLSGLLIGDELSYLRSSGENVFLAAPGAIFELYKTGLETFVAPDKLILLDDAVLERALLIGQRKMLLLHAK